MGPENAPSGSMERSSTVGGRPGDRDRWWPITSMVPNHSSASAV